jgi:hypothetical protein
MPIGYGEPSGSVVKWHSLMDGMVTRANYVEQHGSFSKNGVGKLLKHPHPPSRENCKSVLICMSVSARSTVSEQHAGSATAPRINNRKKNVREGGASSQPEWQEGAGSLLLLAATHQTELLSRLQTALSPDLLTVNPSLRLPHSQPATLHRQLLTLLFLEAVGLRRTWDLRGYTGQALALLTTRPRAYGYRHIERFLAELASVGADASLTEALACWTASLWEKGAQGRENPVPVFYR